jgi:hypothetical protein
VRLSIYVNVGISNTKCLVARNTPSASYATFRFRIPELLLVHPKTQAILVLISSWPSERWQGCKQRTSLNILHGEILVSRALFLNTFRYTSKYNKLRENAN